MKTKITILLLFFIQQMNSQIRIDRPVSSVAFDSLIIRDLNFMVLGDENIKQGISYEYKNDNAELSLSGNLYNKKGRIITIDGKFATDNSVFIFDSTDGSKKGKLTVNLFLNGFKTLNAKNYYLSDDANISTPFIIENVETRQAIVKNHIDRIELAKATYTSIMQMEYLMDLLRLSYTSINDNEYRDLRILLDRHSGIITGFDYSLVNFKGEASNQAALIAKVKEYNAGLRSTTMANLELEVQGLPVTTYQLINNNNRIVHQSSVPTGFKVNNLIRDYTAALKKLEDYPSELAKSESANMKKHWTKHFTNYFGVSPFYERQGIDIYLPTADNSISFKDRFYEVRSDSYGLALNWNFVTLWKDNSFFIVRVLGGISRSNNFIEYKKKEYKFTTSTDSINGIPIENSTIQAGYTNSENREFKYGFTRESSLEVYAALPIFGIFGKVGVRDNNALAALESYPLETGIMLNFKSKDKKNIIALQFLMRRENLKTHPDDDMNFGVRIGLPINLKSN